MNQAEHDDTEMTTEEFEQRIASSIPASAVGGPLGVFVGASGNTGSGGRLIPVSIGVTLAHVAQPPPA